MTIAFNKFVRRQTAGSRFGHTTSPEAEVLAAIEANFAQAKPGYRPGVCLVPVPAEGWFSGTADLVEGMALTATYLPRRAGETPRLHVGLAVPDGNYEALKSRAVACDIVLYASSVLAEDGSNDLPAEEGNWEIVSMNPRGSVEDEPIMPETLMANHFRDSGGTATGRTDSEFVAALAKSRAYWNGKVTLG